LTSSDVTLRRGTADNTRSAFYLSLAAMYYGAGTAVRFPFGPGIVL
jgi:hypothetical protein